MQVNVRQIDGEWDDGYALDKHTLRSTYLGDDEWGHPRFENERSDAGEAMYLLKYRGDWSQLPALAAAIHANIVPRLGQIGLVVPMPASTQRPRQPVVELARAVAALIGVTCFEGLLTKDNENAGQLKNMTDRAEKDVALAGRFATRDEIEGKGRWNALLVDDIHHTGASLAAATAALRGYAKIDKVFVATLTWR